MRLGARPEDRVRDWWEEVSTHLSADDRVALLERAVEAVWLEAQGTLGEYTVHAIARRVVRIAEPRFPALSASRMDVGHSLLDGVRIEGGSGDVVAALLHLLTEFLSVVGNLTAHVLTPRLLAELPRPRGPGTEKTEEGR